MKDEVMTLFEALTCAAQLCCVVRGGINVLHINRLHRGHFIVEMVSDLDGIGPEYSGRGIYESDPFYSLPSKEDMSAGCVVPGTDQIVDWTDKRDWILDPVSLKQVGKELHNLTLVYQNVKKLQEEGGHDVKRTDDVT